MIEARPVRAIWSATRALLLPLIALLLSAGSAFSQGSQSAPVLKIEGAIGPATSDYVSRALADAGADGSPLVLIQMDTPGGLDTSMREIIREILRSPVPVVTYVSPSGARAASAGTFILYASHIAAMAPGTNVGAATPVQIGGSSPMGSPPDSDKQGEGAPASKTASEAKAMNDAIAYARSLAELRGRNVDWAEAAVRDAASLSAQAARDQNVIDYVARDRTELLTKIHGARVTVGTTVVVLNTRNLQLVDAGPDWRTKLLTAITDPNIALILMMIGLYGLLFEFMNPGALYPGTIGAVCLLIGLYALSALPVNYAGVGLIVLGLALIVAEAFSPSFGILGIGGAIAFVLGATILIDTDVPQFQPSWPLLVGLSIASLGLTVLIARLALTSFRQPVVTGREEMIGKMASVLDWQGDCGHVFLHGERWRASGPASIRKGNAVRVMSIDGLTLTVAGEPIQPGPEPLRPQE